MAKWLEEAEEMVYSGRIKVPYTWSVGKCGSRFFVELRDGPKIWATKCPRCNLVYIPPRPFCGRCFSSIDQWVEVSDKGKLLTYTVVHYSEPIQPMKPPFAYGIIQLEGADTGITHLLGETDLNKLHIGMQVQAVFREKREGNILDIKYFKPI